MSTAEFDIFGERRPVHREREKTVKFIRAAAAKWRELGRPMMAIPLEAVAACVERGDHDPA